MEKPTAFQTIVRVHMELVEELERLRSENQPNTSLIADCQTLLLQLEDLLDDIKEKNNTHLTYLRD